MGKWLKLSGNFVRSQSSRHLALPNHCRVSSWLFFSFRRWWWLKDPIPSADVPNAHRGRREPERGRIDEVCWVFQRLKALISDIYRNYYRCSSNGAESFEVVLVSPFSPSFLRFCRLGMSGAFLQGRDFQAKKFRTWRQSRRVGKGSVFADIHQFPLTKSNKPLELPSIWSSLPGMFMFMFHDVFLILNAPGVSIFSEPNIFQGQLDVWLILLVRLTTNRQPESWRYYW